MSENQVPQLERSAKQIASMTGLPIRIHQEDYWYFVVIGDGDEEVAIGPVDYQSACQALNGVYVGWLVKVNLERRERVERFAETMADHQSKNVTVPE